MKKEKSPRQLLSHGLPDGDSHNRKKHRRTRTGRLLGVLYSEKLTPRIIIGYILSSLIAMIILGVLIFFATIGNIMDSAAQKNLFIVESISELLLQKTASQGIDIRNNDHLKFLRQLEKSKWLKVQNFYLFAYNLERDNISRWHWNGNQWEK